jgi:hypothetical protein
MRSKITAHPMNHNLAAKPKKLTGPTKQSRLAMLLWIASLRSQ